MDLLTAWGVSTAVGFLFQPVMKQFAQDVGKDLLKDVLKDVLKAIPSPILQRLNKEEIDIAAGKALKEFLELVQQELQDANISDNQVREYNKPLQKFLNDKKVKEILGTPFQDECNVLDTSSLKSLWNELDLLALPDEFDWTKLGKRYVKKVKAIIQESATLRDILDSKNLEKISENTTETAGIIPEFNLQKYQEAIRECYANLKLDSLDISGYAYNELRLWRMFIPQKVREVHQVLPQVHELPKEHLRRLREKNELEAEIALEELERHKQVYIEQPIRSVKEIVEDKQSYQYVVILGDPGSGKSTLLQYLALDWVEQTLDKKEFHIPIPLLIELRTYMRRREDKECNNFLEFLHKCSGVIAHLNQHKLHEQLRVGNALVMFDGLDEVFDRNKRGDREDVITDIHRFTNEYPDVQVIVTSRVIGYKAQRLRDAEFKHFMLQDLEPEQIQDFINRWHNETFNDEADKVRKRERLQRAIDDSDSIAELAGNPLLLTMMAILNRNQELPRDRAELYNQASRVLLHQWDVERALIEDKRLDPKTIDYKDKQAMLRQVAYHMQTSEKSLAGNLISENDLERILTDYLKTIEVDKAREVARLMKGQLRTRNFMLCSLGANYYAFVHRTFLEYFCAWEFVWQFKETQTLTIEELKKDVFGNYWFEPDWHEVLRLIVGMIDTRFAGEIIDYLVEQDGSGDNFMNIYMAIEYLSEVKYRHVIAATENRLIKYIKNLTNYDKDDPEFDDMYDPYDPEFDYQVQVQDQAVSMIITTWRNHQETLPWLKSLAQSSGHLQLQLTAVRGLAQGWKDDPQTLSMLKSLAQSSDNLQLQATAVRELAQGWKDDPQTLSMLKSLAQSSDNLQLQATAVRELAQGWKDNQEIRLILETLAQSNDERIHKITLVEELARGWKDDLKTLTVLKTCVQLEKNYLLRNSLRETIMQELIQGWQVSPDIYDFLYDCAVDNSFESFFNFSTSSYDNPRQTALEAIIKQYPYHPQTLPLLRDRAENDPDEEVREYAQKKLAELEK
ncbi:NTPase [Nostocales cyanobacterium HT-58-2]|nr:NTPase [Nostocales cyanobacterium HT-58-2]